MLYVDQSGWSLEPNMQHLIWAIACTSLYLVGCASTSQKSDFSSNADTQISENDIIESEVFIRNELGIQRALSIQNLAASSDPSGTSISFPSGLLLGAQGAFTAVNEPVSINLPKSARSSSLISARNIARIAIFNNKIHNSTLKVEQKVDGQELTIAGTSMVSATGELDGQSFQAIQIPDSYVFSSRDAAIQQATEGTVIAKTTKLNGTSVEEAFIVLPE